MSRSYSVSMLFSDRAEAGRALASRLSDYAGRRDLLVLALPRGGVPVGAELARALGAPLDVFVVRKLGAPGQPELALGAIASDGARVLNDELIEQLGIAAEEIDRIAREESVELARREELYRDGRAPLDPRGRIVILVDDGMATGATMRAAARALRALGAARVIGALPVSSSEAVELLEPEIDDLLVLSEPSPFQAVGFWYHDFSQLSDEEVQAALAGARAAPEGASTEELLRAHARRLEGGRADIDRAIEGIGSARVVLVGAAEGSHECQHWRARLTRRLVETRGFGVVALAAPWSKTRALDAFARGAESQEEAVDALKPLRVFPSWAWRNAVALDFFGWLRERNAGLSFAEQAGVYGLDTGAAARAPGMLAELEKLAAELERSDRAARLVVWATLEEAGDSRAADRGGPSLGALARDRFGRGLCIVGMSGNSGTITAASSEGGPAERRTLLPALDGSYEQLFHDAVGADFLLDLREPRMRDALARERLLRVVGAVYHPEAERARHYRLARLPDLYDLLVHFDDSRAVEPLERLAPL